MHRRTRARIILRENIPDGLRHIAETSKKDEQIITLVKECARDGCKFRDNETINKLRNAWIRNSQKDED